MDSFRDRWAQAEQRRVVVFAAAGVGTACVAVAASLGRFVDDDGVAFTRADAAVALAPIVAGLIVATVLVIRSCVSPSARTVALACNTIAAVMFTFAARPDALSMMASITYGVAVALLGSLERAALNRSRTARSGTARS